MVVHSGLLCLATLALAVWAEPTAAQNAKPLPAKPHYKSITAVESDVVIRKLEDAQSRIKNGDSLSFELLSGAPAFYPMANISPRRAFIDMNFQHPYLVERLADTGLWKNYQIIYFPPGSNSLMWKVNATVGQIGQLVRVEMLYTAPPPF